MDYPLTTLLVLCALIVVLALPNGGQRSGRARGR
jgi:hypothetical protein